MAYAKPQYLVETDWLAAHLEDPDLRIYDCTMHLIPTLKMFLRWKTAVQISRLAIFPALIT